VGLWLYLSGMFVVDDLEHEGEERDEDLVAVLQVEAHVERLDVREVLQKVEVPVGSSIGYTHSCYNRQDCNII